LYDGLFFLLYIIHTAFGKAIFLLPRLFHILSPRPPLPLPLFPYYTYSLFPLLLFPIVFPYFYFYFLLPTSFLPFLSSLYSLFSSLSFASFTACFSLLPSLIFLGFSLFCHFHSEGREGVLFSTFPRSFIFLTFSFLPFFLDSVISFAPFPSSLNSFPPSFLVSYSRPFLLSFPSLLSFSLYSGCVGNSRKIFLFPFPLIMPYT